MPKGETVNISFLQAILSLLHMIETGSTEEKAVAQEEMREDYADVGVYFRKWMDDEGVVQTHPESFEESQTRNSKWANFFLNVKAHPHLFSHLCYVDFLGAFDIFAQTDKDTKGQMIDQIHNEMLKMRIRNSGSHKRMSDLLDFHDAMKTCVDKMTIINAGPIATFPPK